MLVVSNLAFLYCGVIFLWSRFTFYSMRNVWAFKYPQFAHKNVVLANVVCEASISRAASAARRVAHSRTRMREGLVKAGIPL